MSSDVDLRPEDFRKAWPTALAVALREASDLIEKVESAKESINDSNKSVVAIAEQMPNIINAFKAKVSVIGDEAVNAQKHQFEILNNIAQSQAELSKAISMLAGGLNRLDEKTEKLGNLVEELKKQNAAQEKKGFLARLLNK